MPISQVPGQQTLSQMNFYNSQILVPQTMPANSKLTSNHENVVLPDRTTKLY
jgi:hypothetical protein